MVQLTRIYTRGGDAGQTSLGDGVRLAKDSPRIHAIGEVDEANAALGLARLHADGPLDRVLSRIQNDLFDLGADLCVPGVDGADDGSKLRVTAAQVARLESEIDRYNAALAPLDSFVLPGGSPLAAYLHLARTVTRRAERATATLVAAEPVNPEAFKYLNRLSDLLFVLSRHANGDGKRDVKWVPGASREG